MKGFAFVLLCALVAVQARHANVQNTRSAVTPALGDYPGLVHLRIAVSTSGFLSSCAGTLIGNSWVLTAASCVDDARYIWVRYGVVDVIRPSLVTENSVSTRSADGQLAIISINRYVESTAYISPIALSTVSELPAEGTVCLFGGDSNQPGEQLTCSEVSLADAVEVDAYDLGAAVISEGVQVGVFTAITEYNLATIVPVADYVDWIQEVTGIAFNTNVAPEVAPETVKFVNN